MRKPAHLTTTSSLYVTQLIDSEFKTAPAHGDIERGASPPKPVKVLDKCTIRQCVTLNACQTFLPLWSPPAQVTTVSLESHLTALGSSHYVPPDMPAPRADCFSRMEIKLLTPLEKGLWSFLLGKKRALGSLNRYITIKGGWKGIKGFTEWMCRKMFRREHNRKQITHRGAGSACNAPRHRNNPESMKQIHKGLEEKSHISVHEWGTGRWKGSFCY